VLLSEVPAAEPMSLAGRSSCQRFAFLLVAFSLAQELEVPERELLDSDDDCQESSSACALGLLQRRARQQTESLDMDSFGENPSEGLLWQKFTQFIALQDRIYGGEEKRRRFENFKESFRKAKELNSLNGDKVFGISHLADFDARELPRKGLTVDLEILGSDGSAGSEDASSDQLGSPPKQQPTPAQIDWRRTKAVTPVKNQGVCGGCWAFVTTESVESMVTLWQQGGRNGFPETFSVQQLLSCAEEAEGCGGGNPVNGFSYLMSSKFGLAQEEFWPYSGGMVPSEKCEAKWCTPRCTKKLDDIVTYQHIIGPIGRVTGALWAAPMCSPGSGCLSQNIEMMRRVLVELGPVAVAVNAEVWYVYKGGVVTKAGCNGSAWSDLDHAAQLTGYDTTVEDGELPYWIVRNQWSTSWGNHGYIFLEYGENTCGLANMASVPLVLGMPSTPGLGQKMSMLQDGATEHQGHARNPRSMQFLEMYRQATGELPPYDSDGSKPQRL